MKPQLPDGLIDAEAMLPTHLTQVSMRSMQKVFGEKLQLEEQVVSELEDAECCPTMLDETFLLTYRLPDLHGRLFRLSPSFEHVDVVGVDATCRRIGSTKNGVVWAVRSAVVWRDEYGYRYLRYGPLLFYLTDNPRELIQDSEGLPDLRFATSSNLAESVNAVQGLVERSMQKHVSRYFKKAIILLDGCLAAQHAYRVDPAEEMSETLSLARENRNRVVAVAKQSKIYIPGGKATSMLDDARSPCLLYVGDLAAEQFKPVEMLGWVFIAKLSAEKYSFRLDVDKGLGFDCAINTVQQLIGNDSVVQGYPETLRVAHMLSILTSSEVVAIQRFLAEEYKLKIERTQNLRRTLFGPFGKWVEA